MPTGEQAAKSIVWGLLANIGPLGSGRFTITVSAPGQKRVIYRPRIARKYLWVICDSSKSGELPNIRFRPDDLYIVHWLVNDQPRWRTNYTGKDPGFAHFETAKEFAASGDNSDVWEPNETWQCIHELNGEEIGRSTMVPEWEYIAL